MGSHRVAVLALDTVLPIDLGVPTQLFAVRPNWPYRMSLCGRSAGKVMTSSGFPVTATHGLDELARADTVIVPGFDALSRRLPADVLAALAAARAEGIRLVSICTGAFALAAAGVLDGRRATTHWRYTDELAARYPKVTVERDVLYVDEGTVLTSAGVAAGIDLCLHVIRSDLGMAAANAAAREIVAAPHRSGGQAQFVDRLMPAEQGSSLAATRAWALERLVEPLSVATLARHAALSERTFARRFVAETGMPPLRWVLTARVDLARELLEREAFSIEQIAGRCGLGSPVNLRAHFRRLVGTTPGQYRRNFAARQG